MRRLLGMSFLNTLKGGTDKKTSAKSEKKEIHTDVWVEAKVDEERVRELVRVRIKYIMAVEKRTINPNNPDPSGLLLDLTKGIEQQAGLREIWQEEACKILHKSE